jgi:MFS transporter, AAHS family, 4-hydroxybenzoate transporter
MAGGPARPAQRAAGQRDGLRRAALAISGAGSVWVLGLLRFIAGLGLGGAMPNAAALASEYVPRRQRPFAVSLTIVCVPLGGMFAAFMSARVIPAYGWRAIFLAGGLAPIVIGLALIKVLPETPYYLAGRRKRWPELIALLRRLGHPVATDTTFTDAEAAHAARPRASVGALFAPKLRGDTLGLIGNVLAAYVGNFALDHGGVPAYFWTFSIGMFAVFISLATVRNHIRGSVRDLAAVSVGTPAED